MSPNRNAARVHTVLDFLRENREWPRRYHAHAVSRTCYGATCARHRLIALFRSALLSNTGGGLSKVAATAKSFSKSLAPLKDQPIVESTQLLQCIDVERANSLFSALIKRPGLGRKKAALFLRDLSIAQSLGSHKIFVRTPVRKKDLLVPFDRVIASSLNRLQVPNPLFNTSNIARGFDSVNMYAKYKLKDDYMLLEDLWFWGYFGFTGTGCVRKLRVNKEKIALDQFFNINTAPIELFTEFTDLFRR